MPISIPISANCGELTTRQQDVMAELDGERFSFSRFDYDLMVPVILDLSLMPNPIEIAIMSNGELKAGFIKPDRDGAKSARREPKTARELDGGAPAEPPIEYVDEAEDIELLADAPLDELALPSMSTFLKWLA